MTWQETLMRMSDQLLLIPFVVVLVCSIILSFKTRFVQIRSLPRMFKILFERKSSSTDSYMIHSRRALFTAMATTIGMGNIVGPIFAIGMGGPGALVGFVLATIFGGATTFCETIFALHYRTRFADGSIAGGPMQYLKEALSPAFASFYSIVFFILYTVWTSNQSNQIAALLEPWNFSRLSVGVGVAVCTLIILMGGVKRVGSFAAKLVPTMFVLYSSAALWIIACNIANFPYVLRLIFSSFFTWQTAVGAASGYAFQGALRWGLAKALQSNEAGMGSAGIAHSAADTKDLFNQGILSIISVYTNGFLCVLSGLVVLITGAWKMNGVSCDISMMYKVFATYFPGVGEIILLVSGVLFAFTTVVGNGFFGTQCYLFATKNRWVVAYYLAIAFLIIWGATNEARFVWSVSDFFMIPVAIPHIIGLVILTYKKSYLVRDDIG